jgi:hypothetical protein
MISSIILLILIHLKIVKPLVTELSYQFYMVVCAIEILVYFKVLFHFGDKYIKGDKKWPKVNWLKY